MKITAQKISKGSLFKLIFFGFGVSISVFCILCGVAAFLGTPTVEINGIYRYGLEGLIYSILIGPIVAVILSAFIWCFMAFGLWIMSLFKPLQLTFKELTED